MTIAAVTTPDPPAARRRSRRLNGALIGGAAILIIFGLVGIFAPALQPYPTDQQLGSVFGQPSWQHPLGLDDGGFDMLSLLIRGARISLLVATASAIVAGLMGVVIGCLIGYSRGVTGSILGRITDYVLVIPDLPLMIVVAALWGPSLTHIILVIGLLYWAATARIVSAQVKSIRERTFVQRATTLGSSDLRIIVTHVVPHLAPLLMSTTILTLGNALFAETSLSFLGLGDPDQISWGRLIENAFLRTAVSAGAWWAIIPPGLCVATVVFACSLFGQGFDQRFNPRQSTNHLTYKTFRLLKRQG